MNCNSINFNYASLKEKNFNKNFKSKIPEAYTQDLSCAALPKKQQQNVVVANLRRKKKKVKKKLKDIKKLEELIEDYQSASLNKQQLEKIVKKKQYLNDLESLTNELQNLKLKNKAILN